MPLPNEHAARIKDPAGFEKDSFRRINVTPGVDAIVGKLKGQNSTTVQSYRFDSSKFTAVKAREWLKEQGKKPISFEAAKSEDKREGASIDTLDLAIRAATIKPDSLDDVGRTVQAILATEDQVFSFDVRTYEPILEVLRMDGVHIPDQIPLLDSHNRYSVRSQLGSIRKLEVRNDTLVGTLHISESEPDVWTKVREGHIKPISVGRRFAEGTTVVRGERKLVGGRFYTAPKERNLLITTRWFPVEGSLTPIGSDKRATIT